jgi:hypothetical protein
MASKRKVRSVKLQANRARSTRAIRCFVAIAGCTAVVRTASAEIPIVKSDTWEVYVAGRVGTFFSYGFGDGYPVPLVPMGKIVPGGGVEDGRDKRDLQDAVDPATGMADPTQQGKLGSMRVRSGFLPNILTLGVRKKLGHDTTLRAQLSMWGTIESPPNLSGQTGGGQTPRAGGRSGLLRTDFREGYLEVEAPWGTVTGGRFVSLFNRGMREMALLYGHGYGVGFPSADVSDYLAGSLSEPGPSGGMLGFGALAATHADGVTYGTPSLAGLRINAGIFEGVLLKGAGWSTTRTPRPEAEVTYDYASPSFKTHLFANGGYQKLYKSDSPDSETMYGTGYGGRFEVGPVHLGVGGHYGKGAGLYYTFDGSATLSSSAPVPPDQQTNSLRTMSGVVAFLQLVAGQFDINLAAGQTQVKRVPADNNFTDSVIKTQTGISAGVVYHLSENFHLDIDFMNTSFAWSGGEKQKVNFINTGVTMTF